MHMQIGQERETTRGRRTGPARMVRPCPSFSTLPDDLLVIVYRLLAGSPSSRARFPTVCRSWRVAVAAEPPMPALPWLLLSPCGAHNRTWRALCPEDGATISLQPQSGAVGRSLVGGYDGGWVVTSQPLLRIVNLFTGAEVPLSEKQRRIACPDVFLSGARGAVVLKIVLSQPPTLDGCIMAAMTENCGIMLCSVGRPGEGWTTCGYFWLRFKDIAICNGDLYGVTHDSNNLLKCEINVNKDGDPVVTDDNWIDMQMLTSASPYKENASYIVDLNGKLMVVVMNRWWNYPKPFFRVFELINSNTNTWSEVTRLDGHALFLGPTFSKAVPVPTDNHGDIERNHIYCSNGVSRNFKAHGGAVFLTISSTNGDVKYHMEQRKIIADNYEITLVGYFAKDDGYDSMWFLPPDI